MMTTLLLLIQQVNIKEKLNNAPEGSYQTGILTVSFIPFVLLVGIAYWMYHRAKKGNIKE